MKKSQLFACVLAVASFALTARAQTRVRLATQAPKGSSIHLALLEMGAKWRQAPGGGAALTVYSDGVMGGEAETVKRIRVDQLQAALLTVVGLQEIDDSVTALQVMPMVFRSLDEVEYVREKMVPRITQRLEAKGFVVLGWGDAGWIRFFSRGNLVQPNDLKRMKIWTWAGDNRQSSLMKSLGYQPVDLGVNDVLPGLQTGMIDVVATVPYVALSGQLYTTANHMLLINWAPLTGAMVVSRKAWDGLQPDQRAALSTAAKGAMAQIVARSRKESDGAVAAMRQRGLVVTEAPPALEAQWRQAAEEIYPRIRGNLVPADMFDEVQRMLKERRATGSGAGGPNERN